eukprot:CAMPEP_0185030582 /NCGR_PEP_ID=MMETSP1103-20130426/17561_1 /TAXON_ID=36769 /ORGANISM="Paraphysomonas bandaiensis, Strain Caron Lab Isolate" /LENGTH=442 /DNA_ID=CAMNT_0027565773 /DNA_START=33 /DNA_END=1358 /DNA_ORIENTATION=-
MHTALPLSCLFCVFYGSLSLQWDTGIYASQPVASPSISTGGDIETFGNIGTLAVGGGNYVRVFYEEYSVSGGTISWSYGAELRGSQLTNDLGYAISAGESLKTLDVLLASAPTNNSLYVFKDTRTHWSEQQLLVSKDSSEGDLFGHDVAVNEFDPRSGIVGAPYDDDMGTSSGSAYILSASPTATFWTIGQKLQPSDAEENGLFGFEVDIVDSYAAITAPGSCQVYLFKEVEKQWSEQQILTYTGCTSLSISQYGERLVVGVPGDPGDVYVLEPKTYRGECGGDFMPTMLSFDEIVAMRDDPSIDLRESIFSFNPTDIKPSTTKICEVTKWSEQQVLTGSLGAATCQNFGIDVDIYEDTLIVADTTHIAACPTPSPTSQGGVHIYELFQDSWTLSDTERSGVAYVTDGYGSNEISLTGTDFVVGTATGVDDVYNYNTDYNWD